MTPRAHRWRWPIFLTCAALVIGVAWWDHHAHYAVRFDAVYFVLVAVVAWFTGSEAATGVAALSVTFAVLPDLFLFADELSVGMVLWNAAATLSVYLIAVFLLSALRRSWLTEQSAARTDALTGLPNRRALQDSLDREIQRARRYGSTFTFAYLDLDGFKSVNDRFGHEAGDRALREVGHLLSDELRDADVVARIGGDEFGVLLPETALAGAETLLRRVSHRLHEALTDRGWDQVTVSVGLHEPGPEVPEPAEVVRGADDLMYEAKRAGKNRIRSRGPEADGERAGAAGR